MKIYLLSLLLFSFILENLAQQKELIHTLSGDQGIDPAYTKIIATDKGTDYELAVLDWPKYLIYTRSEKARPLRETMGGNSFLSYGKTEGMRYFTLNKSGKQYGPLKDISPRFDEEKEILYGYSYQKDRQYYFEDLVRNKSYGPDKMLWYIDAKKLVYSYQELNEAINKKEHFLIINDEKLGPFEHLSYRVPEAKGLDHVLITKQEGFYKVDLQQCRGVMFATYPRLEELKTGWLVKGKTDVKAKESWIYLPDGSILEDSRKLKHVVNYAGDVLRLEYVMMGSNEPLMKVSYKDELVGEYISKEKWRRITNKTDLFDAILTQPYEERVNNRAVGQPDKNYFYSPIHGLVGPLTQKELSQVHIFEGGHAFLKADSSLILNNKKVLDAVAKVDFFSMPDEWFAFQQKDDYLIPYKNGQSIDLKDLPEKYRHYDTPDKFAIKVMRGNEAFIKIKNQSKQLGPIRMYDVWAVSDDGRHYATLNGESGYAEINGKPIGMGRSSVVSWNPKLKAFQWIDVDGQKVYLVTYKLP